MVMYVQVQYNRIKVMHKKLQNRQKIKTNIVKFIKSHDVVIVLSVWFFSLWSWVLFTDTMDLANSKVQGLSVAFMVLAINVTISVIILLQAIKLINKYFDNFNLVISLLATWLVFAFADFLIAWSLAICWLGSQGRLDSVLPLSSPTLFIINTPAIFSTRLIGFFGLAGFGWLIIYLLWNKRLRKLVVYPIILLIVLSIFGWGLWKTPNGSQIKATVISEYLTNHTPPLDNQSTDLVVFPEYGLIDDSSDNPVARLGHHQNQVFFIGSQQQIQTDKGGSYNQLLYGNNQAGITLKQNKYRLIPIGEDMPYILEKILTWSGHTATLDYFTNQKSTLRGTQQLEPLTISKDNVIGAAVCSSIISPNDYRSFTRSGATILSNSASLTIFKGSPLFAWQQKSLAKFMATANSRYFLQSVNSANAYILDNNGRTIVQVNNRQVATRDVVNNNQQTVYTRLGDYSVLLGGIITSILILKHFQNSKINKKRSKSDKV